MGRKTKISYSSSGQFKVAIPKALAESIGLEKGERVEWRFGGLGSPSPCQD